MGNGKVSSKRRTRVANKFKSFAPKWKFFIILGILGLGTGIGVAIFFGYNAYVGYAIGPGEETTLSYSSVFVYDWASGEDLKALCSVSILVNDKDISDLNDIYDPVNYKSLVTAKKPEDINALKLDLSTYDEAIFIINPNEGTEGYWARDYHVYSLAGNTNFIFNAKHESTDIYGSVLDRDSGSAWAKNTNGNYSIFAWFPYDTTTELHWKEGGNWFYNDAWSDLSTTTKEKLENENEWRCRPILFDMNDDQADHERTGDYGLITETTAIEVDFNATIGSTGTNTDVNFTVDCDIDYLVEYGAGTDSDKLYIVFTETWGTVSGDFRLDFEIKFNTPGSFIIADSVKIGSIAIPGRYFNDVTPTFTSLQTLV